MRFTGLGTRIALAMLLALGLSACRVDKAPRPEVLLINDTGMVLAAIECGGAGEWNWLAPGRRLVISPAQGCQVFEQKRGYIGCLIERGEQYEIATNVAALKYGARHFPEGMCVYLIAATAPVPL